MGARRNDFADSDIQSGEYQPSERPRGECQSLLQASLQTDCKRNYETKDDGAALGRLFESSVERRRAARWSGCVLPGAGNRGKFGVATFPSDTACRAAAGRKTGGGNTRYLLFLSFCRSSSAAPRTAAQALLRRRPSCVVAAARGTAVAAAASAAVPSADSAYHPMNDFTTILSLLYEKKGTITIFC